MQIPRLVKDYLEPVISQWQDAVERAVLSLWQAVTTTQRPTRDLSVGQMIWDTTLTRPYWISAVTSGTASWVTWPGNTVYRPLRPNAAILATTTSGQAAYVENVGTYFPVPGLAFDAASVESAFWVLKAIAYGGGNLTLKLIWYADTATSGDVIWGCRVDAITPAADTQDVETKVPASGQTVTDSHLGTTGQRLHTCTITISNLDSLADGDYLVVQVYRDAAAGGDTMTGDAILVDATLSYAVATST